MDRSVGALSATATDYRRVDGRAPLMTMALSRRSEMPSALERRIVARIDRLREEPLLVVGPELAHVLVGLDRRVDELVTLLLATPDVEAADHIAEVVETERPARRVGERDRA